MRILYLLFRGMLFLSIIIIIPLSISLSLFLSSLVEIDLYTREDIVYIAGEKMAENQTQIKTQEEEQINPLDFLAEEILKKRATSEMLLRFATEEVQKFIRACNFEQIFDLEIKVVSSETVRAVFKVFDSAVYGLFDENKIYEGKIGSYSVAVKVHNTNPEYSKAVYFVIVFSTSSTNAYYTARDYEIQP